HALRLQFHYFGHERMRIEDDAVADDRKLALAYDARRQQRQFVDRPVHDQRMAGVMAALEAHDDIGAFRQPVDDLALALVAPLRADDHHIGHSVFPSIHAESAAGAAKRQASIASRQGKCDHSLSPWPYRGTTNSAFRIIYLASVRP